MVRGVVRPAICAGPVATRLPRLTCSEAGWRRRGLHPLGSGFEPHLALCRPRPASATGSYVEPRVVPSASLTVYLTATGFARCRKVRCERVFSCNLQGNRLVQHRGRTVQLWTDSPLVAERTCRSPRVGKTLGTRRRKRGQRLCETYRREGGGFNPSVNLCCARSGNFRCRADTSPQMPESGSFGHVRNVRNGPEYIHPDQMTAHHSRLARSMHRDQILELHTTWLGVARRLSESLAMY
jgi:hypothetical protein